MAILSLPLAVLAWPLGVAPRFLEGLSWRDEILQCWAIFGCVGATALILGIVAYRRAVARSTAGWRWISLIGITLSGFDCALSLLALLTHPSV